MSTLYDYHTGEVIGPATAEQAAASLAAAEQDAGRGAFYVTQDGTPVPMATDPNIFGPLRAVYTQEA